MEELLSTLRELGVYIPQDAVNWEDAQLTKYAKELCPWILYVEAVEDADLPYAAYSRKDKSGDMYYSTSSAKAALGFILLQLQQKRYTAADTRIKADARFRATNK